MTDETNASDDADKVDVKALASTVRGLVDAVSGISSNMQTLTTSLSDMANRSKDDKKDEDDVVKKEDEGMSFSNLEELSREEFAGRMIGHMEKIITKAIKSVQTDVSNVSNEGKKEQMLRVVNEVREKHKDFDEWLPEVRKIIDENRGISLARAVQLAKADDPEKKEKMDKKYAQGDSSRDAGRNGDGRGKGKGFGGLPPGSSSEERNTRMKQSDAAQAAWEEAIASTDEAAQALLSH